MVKILFRVVSRLPALVCEGWVFRGNQFISALFSQMNPSVPSCPSVVKSSVAAEPPWSVCAPSSHPLRSTFWSAKLSLVVRGERVVGRAYLLPCRAVGGDATSDRMLAQPRIRAGDGRRHAT